MLFSTITTLILSVASVASATSDGITKVTSRKYNHRQLARSIPSSSSAPSPMKASAPLKKRSYVKKRKTCTATHNSSGNSTDTSSSSSSTNDDNSNSDSGSDNGSSSSNSGSSSDNGSSSSNSGSGSDNGSSSSGSGSSGSGSTPSQTSSHKTASGSSSASTSTGGLSSGSGGASSGKIMTVDDPKCGKNNPSSSTTNSGGPNGEESWLNCGLSNGGWNPPMARITEIVYISLEDALAMDNSPLSPCKPHVDLFNQYGSKYKIPPIMLASFAMQESTCNQDVTNPAGTIGMFQLAPENCKGVDCTVLDNNIEQACKLINQYLDDAGGNVISMVGGYNGWSNGMTPGQVAKHPCDQQQNLDYLQQFFNGWMWGKNGYDLGTYHNCNGNYGKKKRSLFVPRFARNDAVPELGWHF